MKKLKIPQDLILYLAILYVVSGYAMYRVVEAGDFGVSGGIYAILGMWSPGLAALVVVLIYKIPIRSFGWGWGKSRYQIASFLLPIGYVGVSYAIVWATGLGGITEGSVWDKISFVFTAALPWNTMVYVMVLGEEIGWSGYLVPRLAGSIGVNGAAIARGTIWSTWHAPLILGGVYGPENLPIWYQLITFTAMAFFLSFVFTWLRMASGSLWTGVLLHASHNKYTQGVFPRFTTETGFTEYAQGEFSFIMLVLIIIIAFVLWKWGSSTNITNETGSDIHPAL